MTVHQPIRVPLREVLATAAHRPHLEALRHKRRGCWVSWSWADLIARVERLGQRLQERHPGAGLVVVSGEYAPSLLAFTLAAARIGAAVIALPTSLTQPALAEFLATSRPDVVFVGLREQVGPWRAVLRRAEQSPALVADYHLPWGQPAGTGVTAAAEWLGAPPVAAPPRPAREVLWIEESTDWADGLSYLLHAIAAGGRTLALPESRAAATRDRWEVQPAAFALSAAHHSDVQRDLAARLPVGTGLSARLTRTALEATGRGRARMHHRWLLARLRRPLGLGRLDELTVVAAPGTTAIEPDNDLFATLGIRSGRAQPHAPTPADAAEPAFA